MAFFDNIQTTSTRWASGTQQKAKQDFQKLFDDPKLDLRLCVVALVNLIGTP